MDQRDRLGRYSLVRRVGAGGFATVWLAYDEQLDAEVAIKVLSENWIDQSDVRRRFVAEGRFLRRVESRHVIGVHDIGETDDGRPYLVLTFADGGSLAERIEAGPLELDTAVDVLSQVGEGLQQLHDRGVLHRDVKPANVLFRSDPDGERAMLGDLGLGKSLDAVSQLTMPGGTPAYAAPEQVRGDQLDVRADLYSLGAIAYAALTGQAPHGSVTLGAVLRIDAPPPPMSTLRPEVSPALDAVVNRALQPDRELRWPDLGSFLTALRKAHATGETPAEALVGPPEQALAVPATVVVRPQRRRALAVLAAAVLGGAGGYGGYTYVAQRPVEVRSDNDLTVSIPRDWDERSDSTWTPTTGQPAQPALLVATDVDGWSRPGTSTQGVFLGLEPAGTLPTSVTTPTGCAFTADETSPATGQWRMWTFHCTDGATVIERHAVTDSGHRLRVQVRAVDMAQARSVIESAAYTPR